MWCLGNRTYLLKIIGFSFLLLLLSACIQEGGLKPEKEDSSSEAPISGVCTVDNFRQPGIGQGISKVDVLLVVDTSGSMSDDWNRVADSIGSFVREMPAHVDVRYAVLLGHVDKYAGKIFADKHEPILLDGLAMTNDAIAKSLHKTFSTAMGISDSGSGEALFYSLYQAVTKNAKENQGLGFFRADAALSVVFMSDEQEIGFPFPKVQAPGLPPRCDADYEDGIKKTYYDKTGITMEGTYNAVKVFKGDMPVTMHAIVNITADDLFRRNSKNARCLYDSLGYGYFDVVKKSSGVLYSIQADREKGMSEIGKCVNTSLQLLKDFQLSWAAKDIDPKTIAATVDGKTVTYTYSAETNTVHIENSGQSLSNIAISYCSPAKEPEWKLSDFAGTSTENSITLTWNTAAAPTQGEIQWGEAVLSQVITESDFSTTHAVRVNNLQSDTLYRFQLTAKDKNGFSKTSSILEVRTLKVVVPDPTTDWTVQGLDGTTTGTSATIIWQTPGARTTAELLVMDAQGNRVQTIQVAAAAETQLITVTGLTLDTLYQFQVVATDSTGKSITSNTISKRTKTE